MSNAVHASSEEIPNHIIVWLDLYIGDPDKYEILKAAFSTTTDPNHNDPIPLFDKNLSEIYRTVGFEGVTFSLAAFTNVERCVEFLLANEHRKIFMITSGQMGRAVLPLIAFKCQDVFADRETKKLCQHIYVFCHSIKRNMDWMIDYTEYIASSFVFEKDLLVRMIFDIANYFLSKGKRLFESGSQNYPTALIHLTWVRTLYDRYRTLQTVQLLKEFAEVDRLIEQVENAMRTLDDEE
ncbi:hypothetical protein I4U23_026040 [Adineta vaga]|nr:hypothetical protein I4U23_026040 [Adineta vaga]